MVLPFLRASGDLSVRSAVRIVAWAYLRGLGGGLVNGCLHVLLPVLVDALAEGLAEILPLPVELGFQAPHEQAG